jgi:hypothetical protein
MTEAEVGEAAEKKAEIDMRRAGVDRRKGKDSPD